MVTAASAAAQKLIGYSALKAKQMDVVMGIVSERDVFTTLTLNVYLVLCILYIMTILIIVFNYN